MREVVKSATIKAGGEIRIIYAGADCDELGEWIDDRYSSDDEPTIDGKILRGTPATCSICNQLYKRGCSDSAEFCSDDCRDIYRDRRTKEKRKRETVKRRFERNHRRNRQCVMCGQWFKPKQANSEFCKGSCRVAAHRKGRPSEVPKVEPPKDAWSFDTTDIEASLKGLHHNQPTNAEGWQAVVDACEGRELSDELQYVLDYAESKGFWLLVAPLDEEFIVCECRRDKKPRIFNRGFETKDWAMRYARKRCDDVRTGDCPARIIEGIRQAQELHARLIGQT